MKMKLREIGEFGLIKRVTHNCLVRSEGVFKGIGDDCAVIQVNPEQLLLVTTDLLIERTHFKLDWTSPEDLGAKALAVNLSDIAACGGIPREAFISLAIPERVAIEWLDRFYYGMMSLARVHQVNLLGGDTSESKSDLMINITLTGIVNREDILLRSGACPGDILCLIGTLGESSGGLKLLLSDKMTWTQEEIELIRSHLCPKPLVKEGRILAQSGMCDALIDVSDGLSSDLNHLCEQSHVGAKLFESQLPISRNLVKAFGEDKDQIINFVLNGGEDYALLAAIKSEGLVDIKESLKQIGADVHVIGKFTSDLKKNFFKMDGTVESLRPQGWDHFKS